MVRHTLKILHLLQDFKNVSDNFETSCIKRLKLYRQFRDPFNGVTNPKIKHKTPCKRYD